MVLDSMKPTTFKWGYEADNMSKVIICLIKNKTK